LLHARLGFLERQFGSAFGVADDPLGFLVGRFLAKPFVFTQCVFVVVRGLPVGTPLRPRGRTRG
jgi:hypothetical protein